jgi:hypothetical protein
MALLAGWLLEALLATWREVLVARRSEAKA